MSDEREDSQSGLMSLLAGIGVGVLLGGAIALLTAPQAGEQTRAQIKDSADDALNRLRASMDELRAKVEELASSARASQGSGQPAGSPALTAPEPAGEGSPAA